MTPAPVEVERNLRSVAVNKNPFVVPGFRVAAAASGMRYRDRLDLALIAVEPELNARAAGVFTGNRFCAAPVSLCRENLKSARIRGLLVNAGIANACTGEEGMKRAREMARMTADALGASAKEILLCSTGVIGMQVELEPVSEVMPDLMEKLRPDGWGDVAKAIMTTDLVPKMASTQIELSGKKVTIGGVAKGSGMIAPNMATLLAVVCTDAAIQPPILDHWVRWGTDRSFNCITVDGDTSTNDSLLVLASGRAGNPIITDISSTESRVFGEALQAVLLELAKMIVMDGEGATKFIEIAVTGAPDRDSAKNLALTIANSPLVKTAFFGEDANWGRIVAAAGRAGVPIMTDKVALLFDDVCVFRGGMPVDDAEVEEKASRVFKQKEIRVQLDLGTGSARFTAYTCDFSCDYVKINASYRS
ncbi:MAG: bifunctional glutamate N-acetyltransferase/amino-acid acetyltransferase ArgJ [Syntrophobacteraceae bacterium]|jgi:glutamate N-acetyltransferase/amino-acid N-acetyltransferase|nr:bifunctional glutamate N-acetyltransferase/amino-acid acetyltransferase ArgJ [Syntrophobacteraceae bacterium]NTV43310.1 bifunctional glutamate N-acetyltransferase/amino-acid acetyltransferase ArgJ [Syntrophobacteraceae bacterium]